MTRRPSDLVPWEKVGIPITLASQYGKSLVRQTFRDPTGVTHEFSLFGQRDWATIMPVTAEGLVVTNHEYKQGAHSVVHELPAGTANFEGEELEKVAREELRAETGYEAEELIFLGPPIFMSARNSWTRGYLFLAKGCRKVAEQDLDETEDIVTELIPLERWIELCLGTVVEYAAIVATFRALPYLGYSFVKP